MYNQQSEKATHLMAALDSILNGSLLGQIDQKAQEKLINLSKREDQLNTLLKMISALLKKNQQVIIRLKLLCLLQQLISRQTLEENIEIINSIITKHEKRLKRHQHRDLDLKDMNNYLLINVQLPYLIFLRKMIMWQSEDITSEDTNQINIGFRLINKIKDIAMLKRIFHHYGCYYPTHAYAVNMFKASLCNVRRIWNQVCHLVKDITIEAIQTSLILAEEYLLITAAEETQDLLMEFVYGGYFSKRINREQKIKQINLLKPQIKALQSERKKKASEETAFKCLMQKRESRRSLEKENEVRTGYSDNVDQKLNTEMQMEILDSILMMESLLSQAQ